MDERQIPATAAVRFASGRAADRRVAGVAVAARIVRELAEAGFATAWLAVPAGEAIDAAAMRDVRRLAGAMDVRIGEPPADAQVVVVSPDRADSVDLTNPHAGREILRRTGKATDGPVSRWLNRPISRAISALVLRIPGFAPIHATLGTVVLALAMFASFVAGGEAGLIAGGLLFHAASVFDGVDGEVARATFRTSRLGATLDALVDAGTNALLIIGVTINLWSAGHERALVLGTWGMVLFFIGQTIIGRRAARTGAAVDFDLLKRHYRARLPGRAGALVMEFLTVVSSRDFFAVLFAVLIVIGVPMAVLYIFAAAATVWIWFVAGLLLPPSDTARIPDGVESWRP